MADTDNMMNLADMMDNTQLEPFTNIIQSIMEIPDSELTPTAIESIQGMIRGAMTPTMREQAAEQIVQFYKNASTTRGEMRNELEGIKSVLSDVINDLKPSFEKQTLLNSVFGILYEIFDDVKNRYHNYDIELPITLEEGAKAPAYAHETDACADIYALEDTTIPAHSISNKVRTGLRIALPEGWVMKLAPRSSIGAKTGLRLSNSIGVIDADYRGEIGVLYDNISDSDYEIKAGDRIAQCWIEPVYQFKAVVVDALDETERGAGGFGSTGA
jgi:dUTP pyrophosphatase